MNNRKALEHFLIGVQKRGFQMARIATGCDQDALDIVQDAMMALVKNYGDRDANDWHGLFFKILQTRIYDYYRRNAVKNRVFGWLGLSKDKTAENENADAIQQVEDQQALTPEKTLQFAQATDQLVKAVAQLPIRQQQAFMLRLWEGMSVAETAMAMGISDGSVKTHYARALATLRQQLAGYW
ncbi:MAG: RNA polymerase sigma factor [Gammaproteobacteria bacterium]|nr:MAG: RNA polymerase sigma factor [Gammaproteobacteria bacterium]